jgi:hypothetical protein
MDRDDLEELHAVLLELFPDDAERRERWLEWAVVLFQEYTDPDAGCHPGGLN